MSFDLISNVETCYSEVPNLLYYSHIPTAIIVLIFGIFIFIKSKENKLAGKILFFISILFSLWVVEEGYIWLIYSSYKMMFFWAPLALIYSLINILSFYFVYVVIKKKDVNFYKKSIFLFLLFPIIFLIPTRYNLSGFDIVNCQASEGDYYIYYRYFIGIISIISIIIFSFLKYIKENDKQKRKQILLLTFGMVSFLLLFSWGEIVGSFTENFNITQYGLLGAPVFIGFLTYLVVAYQAFKIKLLGAQALVVSLNLLVGSQYFFAETTTSYVLTTVTLVLSLIFGYILIRVVKRDDERKEQLQVMADKLAGANDQLRKLDNAKTEFISIASHQLRTPITAIKGFASLLLEGSYGELTDGVKGAMEKIYSSSERLVALIEDLLNVSRIESGRMQFTFEKASVEKLIKELYDNFALVAKAKEFFLEMKLPENPLPEIVMDYTKIRELVSNFVDNALKYTEKGGVVISAEVKDEGVVIDESGFVIAGKKSEFGKVVRITVKDTGIGIPKEEIPYLFKKFSRGKDVSRLHVGGTGLGLYVGKAIAEAHHGQVWVESEGDGKGSSFIIEIPLEHV